jgi:class 3 adenylate cyclase/TolB-like protein/Tfp pilus assembly protein PilF
MDPNPVERKLAAILSADVVGYSRLMAEDEAATIRTLTDYREAIAMLVRQQRGRVVDSPGDNVLAEFPSALEAVRGAVEIQRVIQARNANLPAKRRMEFRIGVHLGDVTVEGDRIYGDGVNIAARLEGLAEPAGVCISGTVYEQVEKKLNVEPQDLGEKALKNIARPIHVYGVRLVVPEAEREVTEKVLPGMGQLTVPGFSGRPAIAVLPFEDLSEDRAQEYFADGIAEDLITRLSAWREFPVIARNSSFTYKGKSVDVSGAHVWAERYDRKLSDIFTLQDEITEAIVAAMHPEIWKAEQERAVRSNPRNHGAWDVAQRGWWHLARTTKDANAEARSLFQEAIHLDPQFAQAFAGLAFTHQLDIMCQWSGSLERSVAELHQAARRAVELDNEDAYGHLALGTAYSSLGEQEKLIPALELAIQLNPSLAEAYRLAGIHLALAGRPDEAIANLEKAMRLSPHDPWMFECLYGMALAHATAGRYKDAVDWAQRCHQRRPDWPIAYLVLAATYVQLERIDEARSTLDKALQLNPDYSLSGLRVALSGADAAIAETIIDSLRKAGLKE